VSKFFIKRRLEKGAEAAGLPQIRVHDLRHSHASLLIHLGFSPLVIQERLGHENIETTLNTYSHLYPSQQGELVMKLQEVFNR
jgi:integrase